MVALRIYYGVVVALWIYYGVVVALRIYYGVVVALRIDIDYGVVVALRIHYGKMAALDLLWCSFFIYFILIWFYSSSNVYKYIHLIYAK